jgi:hypothetical protein
MTLITFSTQKILSKNMEIRRKLEEKKDIAKLFALELDECNTQDMTCRNDDGERNKNNLV